MKVKLKKGKLCGDNPYNLAPLFGQLKWTKFQHTCLNPKDRELCQHRLKSGENLMEDRSDTDVQIDSSNVGIAAKD